MTVTTWEEAATAAARTLNITYVQQLVCNPPTQTGQYGVRDGIKATLARLKGDDAPADGESLFRGLAELSLAGYELNTDPFGDTYALLDTVVETICSKQHDYGHENITWGGRIGLVIRMHDKLARIENLLGRATVATNESLEDSWLDLVGYALIGIMVENGSFMLQLAADTITDAPITAVIEIDVPYFEQCMVAIEDSLADHDDFDHGLTPYSEVEDPTIISIRYGERETYMHFALELDHKDGPRCWIASQGAVTELCAGPRLTQQDVVDLSIFLSLVSGAMNGGVNIEQIEEAA